MPGLHDPVTFGSPRFVSVEHGAFQVTMAFFPSRLRLAPHTHERTVLAVTLAGRWTSNLVGQAHESVSGHVLTEPAGDRHSNEFASGGARVLIVQPDPSAAELLRPCLSLLTAVNHRQSGTVTASALRLTRELRRVDDLSPLAVQSLCLELLSTAARDAVRAPSRADHWLTRVEDYLRAHFRECPSLPTLAAVGDVHPAHLTRAFRQRYGTSPAQFVRARRVEWAAVALRETNHPIAEIAHCAGFADQSHLTRLFRRAMGVTPARFRVEVTGSRTRLSGG